jgi:hypothetical protein
VTDGWCWFVLREGYCWLVAGGWFVLREKYCWLVADKPSEQGVYLKNLSPEKKPSPKRSGGSRRKQRITERHQCKGKIPRANRVFGGNIKTLRASPRVCQNLLGKSCVLPTSKKLCKVKKEFISNSLA